MLLEEFASMQNETNPKAIALMVDARTMGSRPSGIGMYLYNFLKEIVKDSRIRLILISDVDTSPEIQDIKNNNVEIYLYGKKVFRSIGVFRYFDYVRKIVKKIQPDLFWEPNILLPLPLKGYGGKVILTIHDIFPITTPKNYSFIYRIYFRFLLNKSIKQTDIILYDSDFSRKETEKYSKLAMTKENFLTYVIINQMQGENLQTGQEQDYYLYVGYLGRRKGTDILIDAYKKYICKGGDKQLYLAGGVSNHEMLKLIKEINLFLEAKGKGKIIYLGYVSAEDKQKYIRNCSCFLFPSRAEGFGMPIIEVMAYYKPVIASDLEIFKELIGDTIYYYHREKLDEQEAEQLAKKMIEFDLWETEKKLVDKEKYNLVIKKYLPETLGKRFINYLFRSIE